ncbi:GlsB/YeaQ/YmgE family stress response membrane protein [Asaia platycodi]
MLAGWIGQKLHFYHAGQPAGFVASVFGAMILLLIYRLFASNNNQA